MSGRSAWREMPVMRSTSSTLSAGTQDFSHLWVACGVISNSLASLEIPKRRIAVFVFIDLLNHRLISQSTPGWYPTTCASEKINPWLKLRIRCGPRSRPR